LKFYLDASFVVSLFIGDAHTKAADRWIARQQKEVVVSELCVLEFAATISRSVRNNQLTRRAAEESLLDFDTWRARATTLLAAGRSDFALADNLIRDFSTKLTAPDALHLASAINAGAKLVTFDERLAEAARSRGADVEAFP